MPRYARRSRKRRYSWRYSRRYRRSKRTARTRNNRAVYVTRSRALKYLASAPNRLEGKFNSFSSLPIVQKRKLTTFWTDSLQTNATTFNLKNFKCNAWGNVASDAGVSLPVGFAEMSRLYKYCSVVGCKIRYRLRRKNNAPEDSPTVGVYGYIHADDDSQLYTITNTPISYVDARQKFYKMTYLQAPGWFTNASGLAQAHGRGDRGDTSKWKSVYINTRRFIEEDGIPGTGENNSMEALNVVDITAAPTNPSSYSSPNKEVIAHLIVCNHQGGQVPDNERIAIDVYFTQYVVFFQPKDT